MSEHHIENMGWAMVKGHFIWKQMQTENSIMVVAKIWHNT